jgi:hypothetical protein
MLFACFIENNNIFGSLVNLSDWSRGGAFVHNLFTGVL